MPPVTTSNIFFFKEIHFSEIWIANNPSRISITCILLNFFFFNFLIVQSDLEIAL